MALTAGTHRTAAAMADHPLDQRPADDLVGQGELAHQLLALRDGIVSFHLIRRYNGEPIASTTFSEKNAQVTSRATQLPPRPVVSRPTLQILAKLSRSNRPVSMPIFAP